MANIKKNNSILILWKQSYQMQILENLGPDWMVDIAAKIEKKMSEIDKQGAS